ncbi:ATP-binding cassette domain-containing protein [Streptomyces sp. NPDC097727]|uniref:ATP-binding cassette domain-containing protein n=1 Tax=Streptomyces sp. NPDC097727 TaxID=3366092 RepID=UPI0037FD034D
MDGSGVGVAAVVGRGVGKRFGPTVALDRVDLAVGVGGVHGLLGPNGAGKTTFLRMVFGLVRPDEGELHVLGREIRRAGGVGPDGPAGFVESPRFYPCLTAERNLALPAAYDGGGADGTVVGDALARVDTDIPDQYRADIWQRYFKEYEKKGKLPGFTMTALPQDHTIDTSGIDPYPTAMVADNDLAVGRVVDTISHSKFWKDTAIFVVQDDSQAGVDHVDGHRAPLWVISPYAKRGAVPGRANPPQELGD